MGFLQSFLLALVLAVTSLATTLGFFHVAQSPAVEARPATTTAQTTTASNNQAPVSAPSSTANTTTAAASSASTTRADAQSNAKQVLVINPATGEPIPAEQWKDCQSGTPVFDIEGNPSGAVVSGDQKLFDNYCGLLSADPSTFVALDYFYGKDAKGIWLLADPSVYPVQLGQIGGADTVTFTLISTPNPGPGNEPFDSFYAKDGNHVYYMGQIISDADPATFTLMSNPKYPDTFSSFYTKDKNNVYAQGQILAGADPATFVEVNDPTGAVDARDKSHEYLAGKVVQ